jgi:hypothetical protein
MNGAWPNLFIVGVEKGGTTSLWRYLDEHPDVFMSDVKEPSFFLASGKQAAEREAAYLSLFAASRQPWRGEASPAYFHDELVPGRIKRVAPDGRILITLRNPVDRAYSAYWHFVKFGFERRSFRDAVDDELAKGAAFRAQDPRKAYIARSFYRDPVELYMSAFGEGVLVRFLEELREDPRGEMRAVYEFLGVDPTVADGLEPEIHNPFSQPRNRLAYRAMASTRTRAAARAVLPEALRARVERYVVVSRPKPPLDADLRERLEAVFNAKRPALEALLGRPLPW